MTSQQFSNKRILQETSLCVSNNKFVWENLRGKVNYSKFYPTMYAARLTYRPPLPNNLEELALHLENHDPMKGFYRGSKTATDGSIVLIFMTKTMLKALRTIKKLYTDGTFEVSV